MKTITNKKRTLRKKYLLLTNFLPYSDWLKEHNKPMEFEQLPKEELALLLWEFYGTVLSKRGKEYSHSGMINLCSGINWHLCGTNHQRTLDFMKDQEFLQANKVFTSHVRDNKEKGLDVSQPRSSME